MKLDTISLYVSYAHCKYMAEIFEDYVVSKRRAPVRMSTSTAREVLDDFSSYVGLCVGGNKYDALSAYKKYKETDVWEYLIGNSVVDICNSCTDSIVNRVKASLGYIEGSNGRISRSKLVSHFKIVVERSASQSMYLLTMQGTDNTG